MAGDLNRMMREVLQGRRRLSDHLRDSGLPPAAVHEACRDKRFEGLFIDTMTDAQRDEGRRRLRKLVIGSAVLGTIFSALGVGIFMSDEAQLSDARGGCLLFALLLPLSIAVAARYGLASADERERILWRMSQMPRSGRSSLTLPRWLIVLTIGAVLGIVLYSAWHVR